MMLLVIGIVVPPGLPAQLSRFVNPLLGTEGGGNTFPGATLPFGMVKAGPDMLPGTGNAGWLPKGDIEGFSQTHVSGTGGGAKYGNILVQPTTGDWMPLDHASPRKTERAQAGFYEVQLARFAIHVEVAASTRASLFRLTYPVGDKANLLIDAGHVLSSYVNQNEDQRVVSSRVEVISPSEVEGLSTVTGGWNQQPNTYTVYFYAVTDTPSFVSGTWRDGQLSTSDTSASGRLTQAWLRFHTHAGQQIRLKIGISFVSVEAAKKNAEGIDGFDFDATRRAAAAAWDQAFATIIAHTRTQSDERAFYTALYHSMLMPADRSGDNPLWVSSEPYYDDFYAIWDTFRTSGPLLILVAPERETSIIRSLVDIYRHEAWLPDARSGNYNGRTQGGSNAEFLITDAFLKKLPNVDWEEAYRGERNDAETSPPDQLKEGRGDLIEWKSLGYVTIEGVDRPASKQMDYAAEDFEVALLAEGLGKTADYKTYLDRSTHWDRLWKADAEDGGFRGFIWPRHRDGSWKKNFDALATCTWGGQTFYEGNSWTYSTYVPHDVARVVKLMGGPETFTRRLDAFLGDPKRYDVGNEPGFLAPYLYLWAGHQEKTAEQVRRIIAASYHNGPSGLPGNDDSGAMSSWYLFGAMGIYPNAGQDVYLIGSPTIPRTTIYLDNGKTFEILAKGTSPTNLYVTSATLNGKPLHQAWFRHAQLMQGGQLVLTMAAKPRNWATGPPPPSASDPVPGRSSRDR